MNKKRVNELLLIAKEALITCEIAKDGIINKTFRGQISTFGAAVVMGSLPAAIAFFSEQRSASVERDKLITALYYCLFKTKKTPREVLQYVCENNSIELKGSFSDAAIALKLAMNFFDLKKGDEDAKSESDIQ